MTVSYVDESGITIKPNEEFTGFHDEKYLFQSVAIPKYKLVDIKKDESNLNYPKLQFVYRPVYTVTLKFTDESGNTLAKDKVFLAEKGYSLLYNAENIAEFTLPNQLKTVVNKDIEHTFVYKKIVKPIEKKEDLVDNKVSKENITKEHTNTTNNKVIGNIELPVNYNNYIVPTKPIQVPKTTNFNNINNNSTIIQNTYIPAELNQKTAYVEQNNEKVDPFLINTGMTKDQKEIFLNYIKEVAKKSREKHGNNQDKINHDIANAIAYSVYHDDFLQTKTNDFGERPENLDDYVYKFFIKLHKEDNYFIDFPHLAAPLATSEKSVWWKESIKFVGGLSPLNLLGVSPKDVLFLNNSMTGDLLTNIDEKDARTNKDAYILKYHPDFKDLSLEERIEKYYSIENLEAKRENYYNEALELKGIDYLPIDNYILINYGAVVSIAGLGLISLTALRKFKKVLQGVIAGSKEIVKHTKDFVSNKITSFTSKVTAGVITAKRVGTSLLDGVKKRVTATYKNIIKPVVKTINKKIIQPITKYIVKPTLKIVNKVIVKPVQKIANVIYNKVVKPIHNRIIKPAAKVISNYVVKSINTFVRPIVKTVTTKVAKPVGNFVAKNIVAPAGRLIKKLFGRN
ncbi:MucBP domain-containing protein [Gemella sp. GH3]|uniref:MucBP domain-containing protein n=1 Tax=unclassified Gemella TaxID=2624949 RepID=UPI00351BC913